MFLLDPWWNPAVEMQAIDRTHRIGQRNRCLLIGWSRATRSRSAFSNYNRTNERSPTPSSSREAEDCAGCNAKIWSFFVIDCRRRDLSPLRRQHIRRRSLLRALRAPPRRGGHHRGAAPCHVCIAAHLAADHRAPSSASGWLTSSDQSVTVALRPARFSTVGIGSSDCSAAAAWARSIAPTTCALVNRSL